MPPTFSYELSFRVIHREEPGNPDMPSLNPNAMAVAMQEFVLETSPDMDITVDIVHARLISRLS